MKLRVGCARGAYVVLVVLGSVVGQGFLIDHLHAQAPLSPPIYSGDTDTDVRVPPPAPVLGPANSVLTDPTFGSRILRVTDQNTAAGQSFIPSDAGFTRTFNADSTAIKLMDPQGWGYWLEFNPTTFTVGNGSAQPAIHPITAFDARWEWSAVDPNVIYFLKDSAISQYNKATGATAVLGGPSNGDPVTYHVAVVGQDAWVCSAAGSGIQDTYTEIYCVNPASPTTNKFIDLPNRQINGVTQTDPNWPTAAAGQTIGIHSIDGSSAGAWLGVTFHQQSWGGNGDAVLNLDTNTWSLVTGADPYWSGHVSLGNGKFVNGSGSVDGRDARGAVVRDANDLMNASKYQFIMQPFTSCCWNDAEHSSWFNSASNPTAPVLFSRYTITSSPWLAWMSGIILAATDGSNTVWRMAHTHEGGCYYGDAFAQISNDGNWAVFSSPWDNTLGGPSGFGCPGRIDTFIVALANPTTPTPTPTPAPIPTPAPTSTPAPAPSPSPTTTPTSDVQMALDGPTGEVAQPFTIGGWALDLGAVVGSGVSAVDVWAWPTSGASPTFIGSAAYGWARPDVGAVFGAKFVDSAYGLSVSGLPPGSYHLVASARSSLTGQFSGSRALDITISSQTMIAVDAPSAAQHVVASFLVSGWAINPADGTAAGVDAVQVYAQPAGGGTQTFIGAASLGGSRPDVAAVFGARFASSGYSLIVSSLPAGAYDLVIYARSTASHAVTSTSIPIVID